MKLIGILLAMVLTGCGTNQLRPGQPYTPPDFYGQAKQIPAAPGTFYRAATAPVQQAVTLEQLQSIKLSNADCPRQEQFITFAKEQMRLKGTTDVNPEDLKEDDRIYNAAAHTMIWSLRIGCNNLNRYAK